MKNIVIIIIDALRPKNLSLFGYNKETDKNLKEIAKESTLFRNFFSVSNSTFPTITSLFTGKYPKTHGIMHQAPYATPEEYEKLLAIEQPKFWLPTYLKNKGYYTIGIDWIGLWFKEGFEYYGEKKEAFYKKFTKNAAVKKILLNLPSWAYKFGKSFVKNKNAYFLLKNTHDLKAKEMETEMKIETKSAENIEGESIKVYSEKNPSNFNESVNELMHVLSMEKQEDEKTEIFNNRLLSEARKVLRFE